MEQNYVYEKQEMFRLTSGSSVCKTHDGCDLVANADFILM